ncbi:ribosome biogenesis protein [Zalerion maritima]|uniref:Ribosome biogenesis regulatory protein n=1 Tax=Zalerion maritima TaxID=339359 RepID=A0AAD5WPY8_9PEZI|nr:ribosome biogenesis protein [Zalerion maritima]
MSASDEAPKSNVAVEKPTPYTFDLGLLAVYDANPLPKPDSKSEIENTLAEVARDGAQAIINQLLSTTQITSLPTGVLLTLPPPSTPLPREKPLPVPKPPTKWERFATKKGIKPKTRSQRQNLQFNESSGEWERKWGYKAANKAGEQDWLVEVDPMADAQRIEEGKSVRGDGRRERKEKVRRNDRKMRRNMRIAEEGGGKK